MKHALLATAGLLILVLLASHVQWDGLRATFAQARPAPLLAAFFVTLTFPLLNTLRWLAVLRALGESMGFGRAFRITMACWPVGTLTPGKAGELLKAVACHDRQLGLGSVLAERVIDVAVLGAFGMIFGAAMGSLPAALIGGAGLAAAMGAALGADVAARLLKGRKIAAKLEGLMAVLPRLLAQPRWLLACAGASALNWFLSMVQLWLLLAAFGAETPLALIVAILPAATFAGLLPVSIAGAGTRDAALLLLASGRIDGAAMLAASVVYTVLGYLMLGVAGLPFLGEFAKTPPAPVKGPANNG